MNNKPQKSWGEIQLAIAALGLTATLAFWNLFSTPQKQLVVAQSTDTTLPPAPPQDPTQAAPAVVTATPGFIPVKIIFGGKAPQQQVIVQAAQVQSQPQRKSGGGGPAPKPSAGTGSSKP